MAAQHLESFATYGVSGSSARVRLYDWFDHVGLSPRLNTYLDAPDNSPVRLAKNPRAVLSAERSLRERARSIGDTHIIMSREATPLGRGRIESRLLRGAQHGVYDFDDALYAGYPGSRLMSMISGRQYVWRAAVTSADAVIAGSDILANAANDYGAKNVVMIPSCVRTELYTVKTDYDGRESPRAVWLGSPSTEPYLEVISPALLEAHRQTGLRLTVISAGNRTFGALDRMVDRVAWTPHNYLELLSTFDFGVMPLPDDEWTRGKCAYKLLQYAAAGLPVVGSGVGANTAALTRLGGLVANSDAEWTEALLHIVRAGTPERAAMGALARDRVQLDFSFDAWATTWTQTFLGARS